MNRDRILLLEANSGSQDRRIHPSKIHALIGDGYSVTRACDIQEAIDAARRVPYELLIVHLEEAESLEVLLAQLPPQISVLIIATEDVISKAAELSGTGIRSFLVQPFSIKKLREAVAQAINSNPLHKRRFPE